MKQWHQENDNPFLGKVHTEETLNILSEKMKQWHQENDNPFLNKKHTEETKKKNERSRSKTMCRS